MINQLMAIKRRREQGARKRLVEAKIKQQELKEYKLTLHVNQLELRKHWREANTLARQVDMFQMPNVKDELNYYFIENEQADIKIRKVTESLDKLDDWQSEQRRILTKSRIDQEKLSYLIEINHEH